MRIDSVRFDASGNATVVASGGISFYIPNYRIPEIPEGLPRAGDELEDEDPVQLAIARIAEEEDALSKAVSLCSRAEQSSLGLKAKLASRGFSRSSIECVVDELESQGILDDIRYASIWARARAEHRLQGPMVVSSELRARGFSESVTKSALAQIDFDSILEKAVAKELERDDSQTLSAEFLNVLAQTLKVRGFRSEPIREAIEKLT